MCQLNIVMLDFYKTNLWWLPPQTSFTALFDWMVRGFYQEGASSRILLVTLPTFNRIKIGPLIITACSLAYSDDLQFQ